MGNRVWRVSDDGVNTTTRKYIVDISGGLPVILCEVDDPNSFTFGSLTKSYIYSDGQILSQRIHDEEDTNVFTPYYYVHDRLGSIRLMINNSGTAVNSYTYKPYGQFYDGECNETMLDNPWAFTGQYYDEEIAQYYLRARQYDPQLMRFTSRDPLKGVHEIPRTFHKYLYCLNNPIDLTDPTGESAYDFVEDVLVGSAAHAVAVDTVALGVYYDQDYLFFLGIAMNNSVGAIMEMHHVYPQFLGGDSDGIRVPLPTDLHRGTGSSLHNVIYQQLLARFQELGAQRNWSAQQWNKMFLDNSGTHQEALQILMDVYLSSNSTYSMWLTISLMKQVEAQNQAWW